MLASLPQFECTLLLPTQELKMALDFCFVVIGVYALEGFYPQSTRCFGENGVKIYTLKNKKVGVPHYKQGAGV